jgi:hypothetical protein
MIWLSLLLVIFGGLAVSKGHNPLASPIVWILGGILAIRWLVRSHRRRHGHAIPSVTSSSSISWSGQSELDMFHGLRGWNESESPPEVATATCSLSGRDAAYLRSLLVMGTLRGDDAGRVVAGAARRLLRPTA